MKDKTPYNPDLDVVIWKFDMKTQGREVEVAYRSYNGAEAKLSFSKIEWDEGHPGAETGRIRNTFQLKRLTMTQFMDIHSAIQEHLKTANDKPKAELPPEEDF